MRSTFVSAAVALLASQEAWAASCCGSSGSLGNRLSPGERGAVTWGAGATGLVFGHDVTTTLGGSVRLNDAWQLVAAIPYQWDFRDTEEGSAFGDASLDVRHEFGDDDAWALAARLLVPTGRSFSEARLASGADVTGRGKFEGRFTLWHETFRAPWFLQATATAMAAGPDPTGRLTHELGGEASITAGWSEARGALSLGLRETAAWVFAGREVVGHRRRITLATTAVLSIHPRLDVVAVATYAPEWPGLVANETREYGGSMALRWAWLR